MAGGEEDGYRERSISAPDGLRLYFRDYGDPLSQARPLLCLSGLVRNSKDFHLVAKRLATKRRVICPDFRGRGRSAYDPDWRNYRPEAHLADTLGLIHGLGLHAFVACGTSFGGLLAMGLATVAPIVLSGVILNDIGPDIGAAGIGRIRDYIGQDRREPDWAAAISRVKQVFPDLGLDSEDQWRQFAEATYRSDQTGQLKVDWDIEVARGVETAPPDLWPLYRAIGRFPVLAIRGQHSDILLPETFDRMLAEKPDLFQLTVPGKGHAPTLDEPLSRDAIDQFLTRLDHAPGH